MNIENKKLTHVLLSGNYVSEADIQDAESFAEENDTSIGKYLVSHNVLTKDLLGQAIAESFDVPYSDLNSHQPSQEQVLRIPEALAKQSRSVLFKESEDEVVITSDEPQKEVSTELAALFPDATIQVTYSLTEDIEQAFLHYQKTLETRFSQIIENQGSVAPEILQEIFEDAYTFRASDIHFEPYQKDVRVRFRVDGVLHEAGRIPKEYYENILNRMKVQSRLRIDEHFSAQDGSMRYEKGDKVFDIRTSIVPTVEGEKVVLRVLAAYIQGFALDDIGLSPAHQDILKEASHKPFGMILVTGPTGSGKTTTLYSVLRLLLRPEVNITTIEDPVEYKVEGINQIQVNQATDLSFAKGLRSVVRQDPDIILVGEIRDTETAEIAVNAALTGHLLLSTFHSNDAATAIPRLLDMEVEPFLLASTLEVVIAQRLVRKICEHCKYSVSVTKKDLEAKRTGLKKFFPERRVTLYAGKGCSSCGHTGFDGRSAIFEFLVVTPEIQDLILKNPSTRDIQKLSEKAGEGTLFEDGIEKVKNGVTTIEELLRVAAPRER